MKSIMRKIIAAGLAAAMSATIAATTFAEGLRFLDVPETFWGYKAIMSMVERGVFSGITTPVNGVGTFAPNADMTRAAYIKTIVAYLYPDEVKSPAAGEAWYAPYVEIAKAHGLVADNEIGSDLNAAMPRQEMAMVSVRAAFEQGETLEQLVSELSIPDYQYIGDYYKPFVVQAVSLGLIAGIDAAGTFDGTGKLSRAAAATVAYRLIDKSVRVFSNASKTTENLPDSDYRGEAGTFFTASWAPNRPTLNKDWDLDTAINKLNGFIGNVYTLRYFTNGIAANSNEKMQFAKIVKNDDGRWGMTVFGWRKSYDSLASTNRALNCVLEGLYYLSGDKQVASCLWKWIDAINVSGNANSDDYGFTDVVWTDSEKIITMNDINIEIDTNTSGQRTYWFN